MLNVLVVLELTIDDGPIRIVSRKYGGGGRRARGGVLRRHRADEASANADDAANALFSSTHQLNNLQSTIRTCLRSVYIQLNGTQS